MTLSYLSKVTNEVTNKVTKMNRGQFPSISGRPKSNKSFITILRKITCKGALKVTGITPMRQSHETKSLATYLPF